MTRVISYPPIEPTFQAPATLSQATPNQNDWYTILDVIGQGILSMVSVGVEAANEDLQVRLTIDGQVTGQASLTATANSDYEVTLRGDISPATATLLSTLVAWNDQNRKLDEHFNASCKVEVRKVTANGAGDLKGIAVYSLYR